MGQGLMAFQLRRGMTSEKGPGWAVVDADGRTLPGRWASEFSAVQHGNSGVYLLSGVDVVYVGVKRDYPLTEAQGRELLDALTNDGWISRHVRTRVLNHLITYEYVDQATEPGGEVWVRINDVGRDALRAHGLL